MKKEDNKICNEQIWCISHILRGIINYRIINVRRSVFLRRIAFAIIPLSVKINHTEMSVTAVAIVPPIILVLIT